VLIGLAALLGVAIAVAVNAWLLGVTQVTSGSMSPTLTPGERVLYLRVGDVDRGDVIVFDGRDSFVPAAHPPAEFVKRVIGVGGDRISCCTDGRVVVNGVPQPEPYVPPAAVDDAAFDVEVPPGKLWVMGDQRNRSSDSRAHLGDPGGGFVSVSRVSGRVVAVVWPPSASRWVNSS
jgi:signal peptidase I